MSFKLVQQERLSLASIENVNMFVMSVCEFCDYRDFKKQIIFSSNKTFVIYPRQPIFKYHFILFPIEHSRTIERASQDSIVDIFKTVQIIKSTFSAESDKFEGFNIFSNNGTKFVGQTVNHSHVHIFLRFSDEKNSPYAIMNGTSKKKELIKSEWTTNVEEFRSIIN